MSVRASDGNMKLLKAIRNPVTDHLPVGCKKLGTSFTSKKLVNPRDLVPENEPIVIVIGSMAHGKVRGHCIVTKTHYAKIQWYKNFKYKTIFALQKSVLQG